MSRRSVTRAVCAPLAIALVTTAIPPAISNHIALNHWGTQKLSAMLASTEVGIDWLGGNLNQRAEDSVEKVFQVREELAAQLSVAADAVTSGMEVTYTRTADAISSGADTALARIDSWMTSASQAVIAMLPSGSSEPAPVTVASVEIAEPTRDGLQQTASLSTVTAVPSVPLPATIEVAPSVTPMPEVTPAGEPVPAPSVAAEPEPAAPQVARQERVPEVAKIDIPAPATEATHATFDPVETVTAMLAPTAHAAAVPAEIKIEAKPAVAETVAVPVATPIPEIIPQAEPVVEAKVAEDVPAAVEAKVEIESIQAVESKPQEIRADEKLVVASLDRQTDMVDVQPVASPAPTVDFRTQETKAEDKLVVASLGNPANAVDVPAPEFKAAPEPSSLETDTSHSHIIDPLQMTNVPMSAPLKIRALTRADIPGAEKLASLGSSSTSDARKSVPEEQRVAYDAPAETETPISIGRRKWTEEAAKYQGLGSPEALLEALKHMGAGAKTLGLPASLWCADFMNLVLRKSGIPATGSRAARSYLQYGKKIDEPRVGAIAIFSRGGPNSGHVGIVRGTDGNGNPIIVSGNHNHKVAEAVYPKSRVIAYVVPR